MKKAFTLIELLVVVLIIGILSAIALPQYQVSVDKTRFMSMMAVTKALKNEQELYYLANGEYTPDLRNLQGALPGNCTVTYSSASCETFTIQLETRRVYSSLTTLPGNTLMMWYDHSNVFPSSIRCLAYENQGERARRLCKSLGPINNGGVNASCDGSCTDYQLY